MKDQNEKPKNALDVALGNMRGNRTIRAAKHFDGRLEVENVGNGTVRFSFKSGDFAPTAAQLEIELNSIGLTLQNARGGNRTITGWLEEFAAPSENIEANLAPCDPAPEPISEEDLKPRNWELGFLETYCGHACTPNGCPGHKSNALEAITIGRYKFWLDCDDFDDEDFKNAVKIGCKIEEIIEADEAQSSAPAKEIEKCEECGTRTIAIDSESGIPFFVHNAGCSKIKVEPPTPDVLYRGLPKCQVESCPAPLLQDGLCLEHWEHLKGKPRVGDIAQYIERVVWNEFENSATLKNTGAGPVRLCVKRRDERRSPVTLSPKEVAYHLDKNGLVFSDCLNNEEEITGIVTVRKSQPQRDEVVRDKSLLDIVEGGIDRLEKVFNTFADRLENIAGPEPAPSFPTCERELKEGGPCPAEALWISPAGELACMAHRCTGDRPFDKSWTPSKKQLGREDFGPAPDDDLKDGPPVCEAKDCGRPAAWSSPLGRTFCDDCATRMRELMHVQDFTPISGIWLETPEQKRIKELEGTLVMVKEWFTSGTPRMDTLTLRLLVEDALKQKGKP